MRGALQSPSSLLLCLLLHVTCSNTPEIVKIPSGTLQGYLQKVLEGLLMMALVVGLVVQVSVCMGRISGKNFSSSKSAVSQRFLWSESLDCCCGSFVEAGQDFG